MDQSDTSQTATCSSPNSERRGTRRQLAAAVRSSATFLALFLAAIVFAEKPGSAIDRFVGGEILYTVKPGDSLARIGSRFGVDVQVLARSNGLPPRARLTAGQTLRVENRHIVPTAIGEGILINVPQRLLFFFRDGELVSWYPVGLGRRDWQTETGRFEVVTKKHKPTWHVPLSIQKEMRRLGQAVRTEVPPGPQNPLGEYWMGLSGSSCGIHGTNAPTSVYGFRSHGCIRLHPDDAADLFSRVSIGTPVWIAYEPVLLARAEDGAVFLEVNSDIYGRARYPQATVGPLAASEGVLDMLDQPRVAEVVASREGIARRVDSAVAAR